MKKEINFKKKSQLISMKNNIHLYTYIYQSLLTFAVAVCCIQCLKVRKISKLIGADVYCTNCPVRQMKMACDDHKNENKEFHFSKFKCFKSRQT